MGAGANGLCLDGKGGMRSVCATESGLLGFARAVTEERAEGVVPDGGARSATLERMMALSLRLEVR